MTVVHWTDTAQDHLDAIYAYIVLEGSVAMAPHLQHGRSRPGLWTATPSGSPPRNPGRVARQARLRGDPEGVQVQSQG